MDIHFVNLFSEIKNLHGHASSKNSKFSFFFFVDDIKFLIFNVSIEVVI